MYLEQTGTNQATQGSLISHRTSPSSQGVTAVRSLGSDEVLASTPGNKHITMVLLLEPAPDRF